MLSKSAAERVLYAIGRPLVRTFYRVSAVGLDNLPDGGFLLVPNHISWVDALVLQLACPRPIRYVIDQEYYHKPVDRKSTRLNSSHSQISYAVFCLKKKKAHTSIHAST